MIDIISRLSITKLSIKNNINISFFKRYVYITVLNLSKKRMEKILTKITNNKQKKKITKVIYQVSN